MLLLVVVVVVVVVIKGNMISVNASIDYDKYNNIYY